MSVLTFSRIQTLSDASVSDECCENIVPKERQNSNRAVRNFMLIWISVHGSKLVPFPTDGLTVVKEKNSINKCSSVVYCFFEHSYCFYPFKKISLFIN